MKPLDPLAVGHIAFASGHVLDVPGIDEEHREASCLQHFIERDPIHAGRLHRDGVDVTGREPVGQVDERMREAPELPHRLLVSVCGDRHRSGRPGSLLTLAPHRSGRAGSAASGSSTDGFATRRRVPAGPGSQAMATAIPKACLASSAIRCRDVETGPNLGVLAVFPSTGATCRCPLPSTGSRGLNSPASAVL